MATPPPGDGALVAPETMIEGARQRAQAAVNTELVMLYWSIGKRLREDELGGKRAEYGQAVVKQLAARLTERHGRGYSRQNLERMMRFADWLDSTEKCSTLSSILSWSHFTELLVIPDEPRREFYAIFAAHECWSAGAMITSTPRTPTSRNRSRVLAKH
ncbi:MAG: DUF1016 N-terminal domain-containing protein [Coriobacteriia bacterium]|nr:DUF1016 N-terminal domain-containing protein [Coriobacteriia bacterium]